MSFDEQIFGLVVSFFVVAMISVCAIDIRHYYRKKIIISGRQLVLRLFGAIFILSLLIRILYGLYWVDHRTQGAEHFVSYWATSIGLTYLCLVFAGIDMYMTMKIRKRAGSVQSRIAQRLNEVYRNFSSNEAKHEDEPSGGDA